MLTSRSLKVVLNDVFIHCSLWHFNLNQIKEWERFFGSPHLSINLICKSKLHGRQAFRWSFMQTISTEGCWEICQGVFHKFTYTGDRISFHHWWFNFCKPSDNVSPHETKMLRTLDVALTLWSILCHWYSSMLCIKQIYTLLLQCLSWEAFPCFNVPFDLASKACYSWDCCNIGDSLVLKKKRFHLQTWPHFKRIEILFYPAPM